MTLSIKDLWNRIDPSRTVLLFGSGSSIPSGAPSVTQLIEKLAEDHTLNPDGFSLSEFASLCEQEYSRKKLVNSIRNTMRNLKPTGGLLNIPHFPWKSLYTTNYDDLIEKSYHKAGKELGVFHCDFCFSTDEDHETELFKVHGTIQHDKADGHNSRMIITDADYDKTEEYRGFIFDRFRGDLAGANLVIIGHSLADTDIKNIIDRASSLKAESNSASEIFLLMFTQDEMRAKLYENRGFKVAFGGIDDFIDNSPIEVKSSIVKISEPEEPLELVPSLRASTVAVSHAIELNTDISGIFNGKSANYPDISAGYTFSRSIVTKLKDELFDEKEVKLAALILGGSGVGKTTCARQVLYKIHDQDIYCWEHKVDFPFSSKSWLKVAKYLSEKQKYGVLFVDDAHIHLDGINTLFDELFANDLPYLKLVLCCGSNQWYPRTKTPNLSKFSNEYSLSKLDAPEIEQLLNLLDSSATVKELVDEQFNGFSKNEKRKRLTTKCEKDMFVCLRNIFANENFDNIILREFAGLISELQEVYRRVAALETAGVRVHRQLIVRLLGIDPSKISALLDGLAEIVDEYEIDAKKGIYGWRCRHPVIAEIIADNKYNEIANFINLIESVIDGISPTYAIEVRSLRELCNVERGIPSIPDKNEQNRLLRKMLSNAPGERVPRHRLIRNLIEQEEFERAETEIRVFENEFGSDGPLYRYKIKLQIERALKTKGIMEEDRITMLDKAYGLAIAGVKRFPQNKSVLRVFGQLGVEYYKKTNKLSYYEEAMKLLQSAEETLGDPHVSNIIRSLSQRMGHAGYNAI